jgi:hypothetical protein
MAQSSSSSTIVYKPICTELGQGAARGCSSEVPFQMAFRRNRVQTGVAWRLHNGGVRDVHGVGSAFSSKEASNARRSTITSTQRLYRDRQARRQRSQLRCSEPSLSRKRVDRSTAIGEPGSLHLRPPSSTLQGLGLELELLLQRRSILKEPRSTRADVARTMSVRAALLAPYPCMPQRHRSRISRSRISIA